MNPALSVVLFTTLSGTGYGLWIWTAVAALLGAPTRPLLAALALGFALVTVGLLSSVAHLGKPLRAWRAFSQWRTSWLSREGVAAVVTYAPALALAFALMPGALDGTGTARAALATPGVVAAALLALGALATVACTAMIYVSLPPIPAWRHPLVLPLYLAFALVGGGMLFAALQSTLAWTPDGVPLALLVGAVALWPLKRAYWRAIDRAAPPATRGDAVGLPDRTLRVFERPHTEGTFVTREMAFVLARRHARRLRAVALALFAVLPALCVLPLAVLPHASGDVPLAIAAVASLAGAFVERWLFFAEAKHVVTLYY